MSQDEKIRASRRLEIKVGERVYLARRPQWEEAGELLRIQPTDAAIARRFVDGWRNIRAKDLFLDGADEILEFDKDTFDEAIGDIPEDSSVIATRLLQEAIEYRKKFEAARKNSVAG